MSSREPAIRIRLTAFDGTDREVLPGDDTVTMWAYYRGHEVCVMPDARGFHLNIVRAGGSPDHGLNVSVEDGEVRVWEGNLSAAPVKTETDPMGGVHVIRGKKT